jgi:hypothetical protein
MPKQAVALAVYELTNAVPQMRLRSSSGVTEI